VTGLFAIVVVLTVSALAPAAAVSFPIWLGVALFLRAGSALALGREDGAALDPREGASGAPGALGLLAALRRAWRSALSRESFVLPASALGATLAIGVFVTAAGSTEGAAIPLLGGPLASAPWMPMSWPLVRSGFGPVALIALFAAAAATTRPLARPSSRQARVLSGLDDLGLAMMASTFVRVAVAERAVAVMVAELGEAVVRHRWNRPGRGPAEERQHRPGLVGNRAIASRNVGTVLLLLLLRSALNAGTAPRHYPVEWKYSAHGVVRPAYVRV
jgi:hypothetical protein